MQSVGLKALKNNLSAYIKAVAAGETVLVTDRDKVVAEIRPPGLPEGATSSESAVMADLIRRGIARPAKNPFSGPPPKVGNMDFESLMRGLDADREDR